MSSSEHKPKSLMSRNKGDSQVITGGRSIKHHRGNPSRNHSTWVVNPVDELDPAPAAKRVKKNRIPKYGHHATTEEKSAADMREQDKPPAPEAG